MIGSLQKILNGKKLRYMALACLLGTLSAYAMAPTFLIPFLLLGLAGLYVLITIAPTKFCAALTGYCFGLGYFGFGLSWIANALLVEGNDYSWAWPLAVAGMPIILSPFPAFACLCAKRFFNLKATSGFLGFVILMSVSEWLRGNIFTGFPWNLYGYTWGDNLEIIQIVSLGDVYLLTMMTIFWFSSLGFVLVANIKPPLKITIIFLVITSFVGNYYYGAQKLAQNPTQFSNAIKIILIQPNIAQSEKWKSEKLVPHFENNLNLVQQALLKEKGQEDIYIILPETAFPPFATQDPQAFTMIEQSLSVYAGNAYLISGALRYEKDTDSFYNSVVTYDKSANIINTYDKHHLVPFGEYMPFKEVIDIAPIVGFKGFESGSGPMVEKTPEGLSYIPAICYEIIFPRNLPKSLTQKSDLIINVTNDGWYGESAGPYQHLIQTRFRAIENGLPLARVANTGISAIFDPYGRIIDKTKLSEHAVVTNFLPLTNK